MTRDPDFRVRDLAGMVLTLRRDLIMTPRFDADEPGYLIEDRLNSKYYRIGVPEYTFLGLLDGRTTVGEALGIAAQIEQQQALTLEQAATVCRWLVEHQLASTSELEHHAHSRPPTAPANPEVGSSRWNPLFLRVPLCRPDRLLGWLLPWTDWLFGWPTAVGAAVLAAVAASQVAANWGRLEMASRGVLSADRWLWLALAWFLVKVVHELAHGLVCRRYGGSVREAGIVLVLAAPIAYMDVTSSWRFRSKWQRMHTAAAGIYVELLIAIIAALLWCRLPMGVASDFCFQLVLLAGVNTLVFNANPLMRFDGYYLISDLVGMPNLSSESQHFLRHLLRRYALGVPSQVDVSVRRGCALAVYGLSAMAWRLTVGLTILLAAAKALRGAGIVLAAATIALWLGPLAMRAARSLRRGARWEHPHRWRALLLAGGSLVALVVALFGLPWPGVLRAPAIVEYAPLAIVRAESPGFVQRVLVRHGQSVPAGAVLAVLVNEPLALEVADLRVQVTESRGQIRALQYDGQTSASQVEAGRLQDLEQRLAEREQQLAALTPRAPIAGTIIARELASVPGKYLEQGSALLIIGAEDRKELQVSIAQEDSELFGANLQRALWVRLHGASPFSASLARISPRARSDPPNPGFCAPLGGALPVRTTSDAANHPESSRYEFLTPRFDGRVPLSAALSRPLVAGQRGVVALRAHDHSIADHLWLRFEYWLRTHAHQLPQLF